MSHDILLAKILNFGVQGEALEWLKSYLHGRFIPFDPESDIKAKVHFVISQGSILLYIVYANDLHWAIRDAP